ncbi:hypothetical protein [uncultured Novosphingobium sp.]|uniref:hypothetical protein n=1 Tax=uncultured Novosphingobium sp. TaxID=292277 RepID=UPI00258C242B|nr:hypothetical protein [uncultured Novosphingobium sp.]
MGDRASSGHPPPMLNHDDWRGDTAARLAFRPLVIPGMESPARIDRAGLIWSLVGVEDQIAGRINRWAAMAAHSAAVSAPQADLARENERLRLENRVLREEREVLKKATQFFASQRP